jgi:rSAM/selenodomain-associated transferase 2
VKVSIVVPVLDEAPVIEGLLRRLRANFPECEVVVVDGGSRDDTVALAQSLARVVHSAPGRGQQLNAGAQRTTGDVLWFVHADTSPDPDALPQIRTCLRNPHVVGGGLSLRFDRRSPGLTFLAWASNLRARRLGLIFGDQAMFVRRDVFEDLGGFPAIPLMEDLEMSRRVARRGELRLLPATSVASARRFEAHGTWRMIVFMQYLKLLYLCRVDPEQIRRRYVNGPPRLRRRAYRQGRG